MKYPLNVLVSYIFQKSTSFSPFFLTIAQNFKCFLLTESECIFLPLFRGFGGINWCDPLPFINFPFFSAFMAAFKVSPSSGMTLLFGTARARGPRTIFVSFFSENYWRMQNDQRQNRASYLLFTISRFSLQKLFLILI